LAEFSSPEKLVHACDAARQAGIRRMDAYSPFPVHGIDPAIGIPRTRLPFLVLAVGLSGLFIALGLQYAVNATDSIGPFPGYPFLISGKPLFSLPANIPVTFEVIVLSSAFATFLGSLALNGLPKFANPLHRVPRFKKATNNGFFLLVQAEDPNYNPRTIRNQLEEWGADAWEEVHLDLTDHKLPAFVKMVFVLLLALCTLPPALIYRARGDSHSLPRLHFNPDMDWQYKSQAQQVAPEIGVGEEGPRPLFADLRAMRGDVPGTVIRGQLRDDDAYYSGIVASLTGTSQAGHGGSAGHGSAGHGGAGHGSAGHGSAGHGGAGGHGVSGEASSHFVSTPAGLGQDAAVLVEPEWITTFPEKFEVTSAAVQRGKQRYDIYCAVCHGSTGEGNGMVNQRALSLNALQRASWINAKSLHDHTVVNQPVGRIFDTISNGRGGMGPYRSQIPVADRWAIVLYIKALQDAMQNAVALNEEGDWVPVRTAPPAEAAATPPAVGVSAPVGDPAAANSLPSRDAVRAVGAERGRSGTADGFDPA
jgi:mono/diheme cytochrome c family protein